MGRLATEALGTRTPLSAESTLRSTVPNVSVAAVGVIQSLSVWQSSLVLIVEPGNVGLNWPRANSETLSPAEPQPAGISGVVEPGVSDTTMVPASRSTDST